MSLEIKLFKSILDIEQMNVAIQIEDYTTGKTDEQPQMLPVTVDEVFSKHLGMVAYNNGEFAGYVSLSTPELWQGNNMTEVGTLWVPKEHRGHKIGHLLVGGATNAAVKDKLLPYGFCNSLSLPIFKDTDFIEAGLESIPPSALSLCATCPAPAEVKSEGCCDTIVVWGGAK